MLRNYLKTAFRNLSRHKSTSIINIAGLMVGFSAFLLIFLVIEYEQSFDSFHAKRNDIYRVVRIGKNSVNKEYRAGVPFPVPSALRNEFADLVNAGAIYDRRNAQILIKGPDGSTLKKFKETSGVFVAEPQFFQMFDFGLAEGNIRTALTQPNTVLLTKDIAAKYFDNWKNAVGKTLSVNGDDFKITGVLNNPPNNTDFPLRMVGSYATFSSGRLSDWEGISDGNYCFVQLPKGSSSKQFEKLLAAFVDKHIKPVNPNYDLALQPLNEVHYDERYGNFNGRTFSKDLILALSLIGLFLLIIACVNFINLTTAQAITRAREVGVRKVLGSRRTQLVLQFLGETGVTSLLAVIGSVVVTLICIPFVNDLLDIHLSSSILYTGTLLLFMVCALLLVTFLSGFYPAMVLSGFNSATVLKGTQGTDNQKGVFFRRGLVVFQFVIAQALIIGTLVVASQMDYFRNADMGFNKQAVIYAGLPGDSLSRTKFDQLKNELHKMPGVENVSLSTFTPAENGGWFTDLKITTNHTNNPDIIVNMKPADTSYFSLYNLPLVAGRIYFPSDTMREFVVNETIVRRLGIRDPQRAINMPINVDGRTFPIVGVVKDFHVNSLRDPIDPVVLTTMKDEYGLVNVRINLKQAKAVIPAMEHLWNKSFPDYVLEYGFLDQTIADYYKQENQISQLYKIFSGIAIFISCLGLYGLISFMAIRRKKEIGIRKVLGAPVSQVVIMLSKEFTILIVLAFFIASPIAWYFMHHWLQQYTYRILIGTWLFAATILGSLVIAWLTVGYTAIKAAVANPVKSLRTE